MTFRHEPDLAKASTLPSEWYTSEEFLRKDYLRLFNRSWNLVGRAEQVRNPGDYFTAKIGQENIVVARTPRAELKGYFNVCRHRAGPVARGCGNTSAFKCLYHAWTYDLDGQLKTMPEFQGVENFKKEDHPLPPIQVAAWGPLVFAAIQPAMTFEEFLGKIPEELDYLRPETARLIKTQDYEVAANWKVYVDNYLEGYHLPAVHPDLCKELDYKRYHTETFDWYSLQHAPAKDDGTLYKGLSDADSLAHYYWLFPNLMFNVYQGIFQTNLVIPQGPDRCLVRFDWYVLRPEAESKLPELMRFSDQLQDEDALICNTVQENLKSISYTQGRYCVRRENGVHHFHSLVSRLIMNS